MHFKLDGQKPKMIQIQEIPFKQQNLFERIQQSTVKPKSKNLNKAGLSKTQKPVLTEYIDPQKQIPEFIAENILHGAEENDDEENDDNESEDDELDNDDEEEDDDEDDEDIDNGEFYETSGHREVYQNEPKLFNGTGNNYDQIDII